MATLPKDFLIADKETADKLIMKARENWFKKDNNIIDEVTNKNNA